MLSIASALASVLLVGVAIETVLRDLLIESAESQLNQRLDAVSSVADTTFSQIDDVVDTVAADRQVEAALHLVEHYRGVPGFSFSVLERESEKILFGLRNLRSSASLHDLVVFDAACRPISFVSTQLKRYEGGIASRAKGRAIFRLLGRDGELWDAQHALEFDLGQPLCVANRDPNAPKYVIDGRAAKLYVLKRVTSPDLDGKTTVFGTVLASISLEAVYGGDQGDGSVSFELRQMHASGQRPGASRFERLIPIAPDSLQDWYLKASYSQDLYINTLARTRSTVLLVLALVVVLLFALNLRFVRVALRAPLARLDAQVKAIRERRPQVNLEHALPEEFQRLSDAMRDLGVLLLRREEELDAIVSNLPLAVFVKDPKTLCYIDINPTLEGIMGISRADAIGKDDFDLFEPEQAALFRANDLRAIEQGSVLDVGRVNVRVGDRELTLRTRRVVVFDEHRNVRYLLGVSEDITEMARAEQALEQWAVVSKACLEGVAISDGEGRIVAVNRSFERITGYSSEEVLGKAARFFRSNSHDNPFYDSIGESLRERNEWRGEITGRRKDGDAYPVWQTISKILNEDGSVRNYISVFSDITEIKRAQAEVDFLAYHDSLTGLANRALLNQRIEIAIRESTASRNPIAVVFLDLDRFKDVNDSLGHAIGDRLLTVVAERLRSAVRDGDTVARQGGDEFIVLLTRIGSVETAAIRARQILACFEQPFKLGAHEITISPSLGVSLFPGHGATAEALVRNADAAMYKAKEAGRNCYWLYTEQITEETKRKLELTQGLKRAVKRSEFELYYQPQCDVATANVIGAEALLRWQHRGEWISPAEFVPIAEAAGLIHEIGEWVMHTACKQFMAWRAAGMELDRISVNVSTVQVARGGIADIAKRALASSGMPAETLELELTEAVMLDVSEASIRFFKDLRTLGVQLALDDFGTGFSSLTYLKSFPFNRLKIDRSFVRDMLSDPNDQAIVDGVVKMCEGLRLQCIAEGVETEAQLAYLASIGCGEAQGYLFGRPMPADDFQTWWRRRSITCPQQAEIVRLGQSN